LKSRRVLVVNADDFGFTRDVNQGIVEAHQNGILSATTLMANGAAFEHAVRLSKENPTLDVGCHLVLAGGCSVLPPFRRLPRTVSELVRAALLKRIRIYEELAGQVRKILAAGIRASHLDTHKHTLLLPAVLDAVARISEEFGIPWVRLPLDVPLIRNHYRSVLQRHGCRMTDRFAGFSLTGRLDTKELLKFIRALPDGTTELMCHPGRCGPELRSAPTRLKESREQELAALIAPEIRNAIGKAQVLITNYRDLRTQQ
jgi:predicted glycoside hydrolase/deacetylase ChbG (UPF0249 family)